MNTLDLLQSCLLEIVRELEGTGVTLTVGGGYGLILKSQHVASEDAATLLPRPPQLRSTNDLDLFLRVELLASPDKARLLAGALTQIDFKPVETAKYYQFVRSFATETTSQAVKVDLLTGPPGDAGGLRLDDDRRVKPGDRTIALHARRTEEAVAIEEGAIRVTVWGHRLNGEEAQGVVDLPNAFSYLLMKLHAFQDKEERADHENASKHAADLYQILSLTTEPEWETAKGFGVQYGQNPVVRAARAILQEFFAASNQLGILRLREYSPFFRQINVPEFCSILSELFPHVS